MKRFSLQQHLKRLADETFLALVLVPFVLGAFAFFCEGVGTALSNDGSPATLFWAAGLMGFATVALVLLQAFDAVRRVSERYLAKRTSSIVMSVDVKLQDLDRPPSSLISFASSRPVDADGKLNDLDWDQYPTKHWVDAHAMHWPDTLRAITLVASPQSLATSYDVRRRFAEHDPSLVVSIETVESVVSIEEVQQTIEASIDRLSDDANAVAVDLTGGPSATTAAMFVGAQRKNAVVTVLSPNTGSDSPEVQVLLPGGRK